MIGQMLGSYRLEAELGSGAMGVVYLGSQEGKDRKYAIKVISSDQAVKGKAFDRFQREIEILEHFRHPNIVKYIAKGRYRGTNYYVMEYLSGPTLDKVLREERTFPWRKVAALGYQLCDALQYAHDHGVIHRDLKPSNLMVTDKNVLKLTDFGIAKDLDRTALTATGRTLGTAAYMAPEQIRGTPEISHKTDLYALGVVFYQMLTGELPFDGATAVVMMHQHINQAPPKPSRKVEEIPRALDELVVSLMAKSPSDRPWDAAAVGLALKDLLDKASRQETIPMVWPEPGTAASMPQRAEILTDSVGPRPVRKKKGKKSGPAISLEAAGLLLGLVVVGSAILYVVWPPGAGYLYRHAEALMASADPLDWVRGRDDYLEPLDRRFPGHPYKEKTEGWRDRIDLREAQRRADVLEKPNLAAFSKPKTEVEALYAHTFEEASAALKRHHDGDAESLWREMVKQLPAEGRENRGWILLAQGKADEVAAGMKRRRDAVAALLAKGVLPPQLASSDAARKYATETLRDIVERFGSYPDVADLVENARAALVAIEGEKPIAAPEPSTPGPERAKP